MHFVGRKLTACRPASSWELVNEPWIEAYQAGNIPWDFLADYMDRAYATVREHENVIAGNNVSMVVVHDAFQALDNWKYWFTESKGAQWVNYGIDTHLYHAWSPNADLDNYGHVAAACGTAQMLAATQEWIPTVSCSNADIAKALKPWTFSVRWRTGARRWYFLRGLQGMLQSDFARFDDKRQCGKLRRGLQQLLSCVVGIPIPRIQSRSRIYLLELVCIVWLPQYRCEALNLFYALLLNRKAISPVWSYEQSVTQRWIPVDLDDTLYAQASVFMWATPLSMLTFFLQVGLRFFARVLSAELQLVQRPNLPYRRG